MNWLLCLAVVFVQSVSGAEVTFVKKKIRVGPQELIVEVADTPERSARGLMFRKDLKEGTGMIFVFPDESVRTFWMKNTFIPLSIGFFDSKRRLVDVQEMTPVKSEMDMNPPTYTSAKPAKYALEVPPGWFKKHKVKLGDTFTGL